MFVSMWAFFPFFFLHILSCGCYFGGRQLPPETSIRMRPPYAPFSPHSSRVRTEQLWWFHLHTNNQPGLRQPPSVWLLLSLTSPAVQQEWRSHASVINCLEPREWRRAGVTQLKIKKTMAAWMLLRNLEFFQHLCTHPALLCVFCKCPALHSSLLKACANNLLCDIPSYGWGDSLFGQHLCFQDKACSIRKAV